MSPTPWNPLRFARPLLITAALLGLISASGCGETATPAKNATLPDGGSGFDGTFTSDIKDQPDQSGSSADSASPDTASPDSSTPGTDTAACQPKCLAVAAPCGLDGCGGNCGYCQSNWACVEGECKELASPDACKTANCDLNAYCTLGAGGAAQCKCKPGWEGDGKLCSDANECLTDNGGCAANALCTNKIGEPPKCECKKGFSGNGAVCDDDDECKEGLAKCAAHAICSNTPGSYDCACDKGFGGDGLNQCKDIDECADKTANCAADQGCENTEGGFLCTCPAGYTKGADGCKDLDECAATPAPCDANATCSNSPGSYTCACKAGFSGDGKTCTEVDLCKGVTCGTHAACQKDAAGKAICVCVPGYSGDGKTCTAAIVNITLLGVYVAPLASDGQCWDLSLTGECPKLSATALSAVDKAYAELAAAAAVAGGPLAQKTLALESALGGVGGSVSRPDAYGNAELKPVGSVFPLSTMDDTYTPVWSGVKWSKVPLDGAVALKLSLLDEDLAWDEEIGAVTVQIDLLGKALAAGQAVALPVKSQQPQILAVKVLVTAWQGCGDGKCTSPETAANCAADCATSGPKCGDAKCDSGETIASCPADCQAKAGSCVGFCGKQSSAGCWCDDLCVSEGDCCADKAAVCSFGCKGKCGQKSQESTGAVCWCDDMCDLGGDCCKDYAAMCKP
jgi:hypothetical protein